MRRSPVVIALDHLVEAVDRKVDAQARADLLMLLHGAIRRPNAIVEFLKVMAQRRIWPGPEDVRRWVRLSRPAACERCEGTGWILLELWVKGESRPAATRCLSCQASRRERRAAR